MSPSSEPSFWDAVRAWADDAGLLLPQDLDEVPSKPKVPQAVCDSCPICQGAATLDQVNPELFTDLAEMARSVVSGLASAMASASDHRDPRSEPRSEEGDLVAVTDVSEPEDGSVVEDPDDADPGTPDPDPDPDQPEA